MELDILKIDLDENSQREATICILEKIKYFNKMFEVDINFFEKVELIKKSKYSAKIKLNKKLKDEKTIIILQLIFGSDWRKEINTFYNHEVLNMEYSNRLFTSKKYNDGFTQGEIIDITNEIKMDFRGNL